MTGPCEPSEPIHCRLRLCCNHLRKCNSIRKCFCLDTPAPGTLSHESIKHDDTVAYGRLMDAGYLSARTAVNFIRAVSICPSLGTCDKGLAAAETAPAAAEKETVVEEPASKRSTSVEVKNKLGLWKCMHEDGLITVSQTPPVSLRCAPLLVLAPSGCPPTAGRGPESLHRKSQLGHRHRAAVLLVRAWDAVVHDPEPSAAAWLTRRHACYHYAPTT